MLGGEALDAQAGAGQARAQTSSSGSYSERNSSGYERPSGLGGARFGASHASAPGRGTLIRQAVMLLVHHPASASAVSGQQIEAVAAIDRPGIPAGVREGQHLRLAGQGMPGFDGGPAGDLYLEIGFAPHPLFRVDGRDVYLDLPLAPWEAALGATVDAPLPEGSVQLTVPAGSAPGRKLRLKGKGIPGATPGDLYVVLQIAMPAAPDDAQRRAWEELARRHAFNPRQTMGAP